MKSVDTLSGKRIKQPRVMRYSKDAYFDFEPPTVPENVGITDLMSKLEAMTSCINSISFLEDSEKRRAKSVSGIYGKRP